MKRENRKINKDNLHEIVGAREELKAYLGEVLECQCFVTNSVGFMGDKRLITEIRIPDTNLFVKHAWVKERNLPLNVFPHGYSLVKFKVIKYTNHYDNTKKYGIQIAEKLHRAPRNNKTSKPKWKKHQEEALQLKQESQAEHEMQAALEKPFGKIRKVTK